MVCRIYCSFGFFTRCMNSPQVVVEQQKITRYKVKDLLHTAQRIQTKLPNKKGMATDQ